jgi:hypothetical protein
MSERDRPQNDEPLSPADRTLLGVAPPQLESAPESALRSPVFVRAGTSVTDVEPPPLPRMALPARTGRPGSGAGASDPPPGLDSLAPLANEGGSAKLRRVARSHPGLWMVLAPAALATVVIGAVVAATPARAPKPLAVSGRESVVAPSAPSPAAPSADAAALPPLSELEAKAPEALSATDLLRLADSRLQRKQADARALRERLQKSPELANEKATQAELLRLAKDTETAHEALAALAGLESPLGADLLYEVWAGTAQRSESTELARTLAYSTDVRPRASAALAVALELRASQTCEAYKDVLPRALKDGDRRSVAPLTKLAAKRGCGPRKADDCYACLRGAPDELVATINAAKSRRPPAYPSP